MAITELSKFLDIRTYEQSDGRIYVSLADGTSIVSDLSSELRNPGPSAVTAATSFSSLTLQRINPEGGNDVGPAVALEGRIRGGEFRGLLDLRDRALPDLAEQLGLVGSALVEQLNAVHNNSSSVPAPASLTGRNTGLFATGALNFTGNATIAVVDAQGALVQRLDLNQQLADILFEKLKLPVMKKNKTGYSTDAEVLERHASKHEIAALILAQRELAKLINTYTDVLRDAIAPETGRIHATFQQTTGVSGRLISTDPDLRRTPTRTPEGRRIRRAFVAPPGMRIVSADWSQIELRVLAHFSKDPRLLEAFRDKLDLHRRTAGLLFGVDPEAVTKEQRSVGKTVNFATIYGQGATALGQILGVPRKDAQSYIERYFADYAGVRQWLDRTIADAHASGHVTTILGRRRTIPELSSRTDSDRAAGERIAANTPIQGSASDLCKLAMLQIDRGLPSVAPHARMLLQVHDELVFEAPEAEVTALGEFVRGVMERPYPLDVPLARSASASARAGATLTEPAPL